MGDVRFEPSYHRVRSAPSPVNAIRALTDEGVVAALAAASNEGDPYLANVLASEAMNRARRKDLAFRHAGEGIVAVDHGGRVTLANPAAERLLGRQRDQMVGEDAQRILSNPARPAGEGAVPTALDTGETVQRFGEPVLRADGAAFQANLSAAPIVVDGEVEGAVVIFEDVTGRVEAEAARARLAAIVESSSDAIIGESLDGTVRSWNGGAERLFGYTAEEMVGGAVARIIPPHRRAEFEDVLARMARGERVRHYETERVAKGGRLLPVSITVSPIRGEGDEVVGVSAILRDITERRRRVRALRESEGRFRALSEATFEAIAIHRDGVIIDVNSAFTQHTGYTRDEVVGREGVTLLVAPEHRERPLRAIAAGEGGPYEVTLVRKDGSRFPAEVRARDAEWNGEAARIVAVVDITERKRAEAALRESEARHRALFERVPTGLYRTAPDGEILDANPAMARLFGYPERDGLLATNITALYADPADRDRLRARAEREGGLSGVEIPMRRRDGAAITVRASTRAVRDDAGSVVCYEGAFEDVTQRKRKEEALRRSEARYAHLFACIRDGIVVVDAERHIAAANPAFSEMVGRPTEEMVGRPTDFLFASREGAEALRGAVQDNWGGPQFTRVSRFRRRDGSEFSAEVAVSYLKDDEGEVEGTIGVVRDVTDREAERRRVEESERRLAKLVGAAATSKAVARRQ